MYDREDAVEMASSSCCGEATEAILTALDGALMSAFIRATKPSA